MEKTIVIVGASIAGINVMNTLVKNEYPGNIILIDKKETFPYNPYRLSKDWMLDLEKTTPPLLKKAVYYQNHNIDLKLNTEVVSFDPNQKRIITDKDEEINYDILVLATGSKLNTLSETASNLLYLRTFTQAMEIKNQVKTAHNITIIGAGFIGLELASTFTQLGKQVTVIFREKLPLERIVGTDVANYVVKMHQDQGVTFVAEDSIKTYQKEGNTIKSVITENGKEFNTDLVIAAIGVKPNISLDNKELNKKEAIVVDKYHRTSIPDVYAAGDNTLFPYQGGLIRIDHWEAAYNAGINVAENIISNNKDPYDVIPYFWTDQYDQTLECVGHARNFSYAYLRKSDDPRKFIVAYTDENQRLLAVLFANHAEKRSDVENFLSQTETLIPENFIDSNKKLL